MSVFSQLVESFNSGINLCCQEEFLMLPKNETILGEGLARPVDLPLYSHLGP